MLRAEVELRASVIIITLPAPCSLSPLNTYSSFRTGFISRNLWATPRILGLSVTDPLGCSVPFQCWSNIAPFVSNLAKLGRIAESPVSGRILRTSGQLRAQLWSSPGRIGSDFAKLGPSSTNRGGV